MEAMQQKGLNCGMKVSQHLVNPDVPESRVGCLGHDRGHAEDDGQLAGAGVRSDAGDHEDNVE